MIAVCITARASYTKAQPVIAALIKRHIAVHLVVGASALLERYGKVIDIIKADFPHVPLTEIWSTYEGATLVTSAKETGALLNDVAICLSKLQPHGVLICADRHEVLALAQASAYLNFPIIHLQGGERSGSIDDRIRDAITALADYHCVCTAMARHRVYSLTGNWDRIYQTGCPSIDVAKAALGDPPVRNGELPGVGPKFPLDQPFLVVLHHPVTDEPDAAGKMQVVLEAIRMPSMLRALVFWPGQDAGAEAMAKVLRLHSNGFHFIRNLSPRRFLRLLSQAACLVGNSSAGIRESSYLGVPVVNIGTRQRGRERAQNVRDVSNDRVDIIREAIQAQIAHGVYPSSPLYGTGHAAEGIADLCQTLISCHV